MSPCQHLPGKQNAILSQPGRQLRHRATHPKTRWRKGKMQRSGDAWALTLQGRFHRGISLHLEKHTRTADFLLTARVHTALSHWERHRARVSWESGSGARG